MSLVPGYNDPIRITWNVDEHGQKVSVEMQPESHFIAQGRITLIQIPDHFYKVQIPSMVEIYDQFSTIQSHEFRVDYQSGIVMFHPSLEGQEITVSKYWGRGIILTPASRIYTTTGEGGEITETLGEILDSQVRKFIFSTNEPPLDVTGIPDGSVWFVYEDE